MQPQRGKWRANTAVGENIDVAAPTAPPKLIREMLPLHVQEVLPFPAKDAVLDL
jgi:hypothetical protein